ncbi:MAG: VRR-NUC domain-containing protein [Verrucomicrobiales bacterium]|nr:VRR-NUC domain-containing protein [Verrucomicrobiales bacterium]
MRRVGAEPDIRIFRNQVGVGWVGRVLRYDAKTNVVVLQHAQRVTMGLTTGSSDLIGWKRRIITPGDVGNLFAQFLGIEVKTETGAVKPGQENWRNRVIACGGIAIVARSAEDAVYQLEL